MADQFLVTPNIGLQDIYVRVKGKYPSGSGVNALLTYHIFSSDTDNVDYGKEIDLALSMGVTKNLKVVAKYAGYRGDDMFGNPKASDVDRASIQVDIAF